MYSTLLGHKNTASTYDTFLKSVICVSSSEMNQ